MVPSPDLFCSAAFYFSKIIWHGRRDSAAASHVAERKRTDKKCVRPGTHSPGFLSDDLVGVGQLDPAALAGAALPTASPNLSGHWHPRCTSGRQEKTAGPDIPSFLSSHFVCPYVPRLRHELYHSVRDRLVISSTPCWPPCRVPCWPGRRPPRQRLGPVAASTFSSRAKRRSLGRARSTRGPDTCKTFPPTICAFWGGVRRIYSRGGGGGAERVHGTTGRPLSLGGLCGCMGFPILRRS